MFQNNFLDSLQNRIPHPDRPKCNSILHLCGSWLFEAAFIGSEYSKFPANDPVATIPNDQTAAGLGPKLSFSAPSLSPKPVIILSVISIILSFLFCRWSFTFLLNICLSHFKVFSFFLFFNQFEIFPWKFNSIFVVNIIAVGISKVSRLLFTWFVC